MVLLPNRRLDYGKGFYTTTSEQQAKDWARRRMGEKKATQGYVNIYELDKTVLTKLKCPIIPDPTEEWVNFVMKNRMQRDYTHNYDIVYGPVADNSVYTQLTLYEGGIISMPTLIRELKTYKLVGQYLVTTKAMEKAFRATTIKTMLN